MKKLILEEVDDIEEVEVLEEPAVEEPISEADEETNDAALQNILSEVIKSKWTLVDLCRSAQMYAENKQECLDILDDIITDEYTHIGLLEGLVKDSDPAAANLDTDVA